MNLAIAKASGRFGAISKSSGPIDGAGATIVIDGKTCIPLAVQNSVLSFELQEGYSRKALFDSKNSISTVEAIYEDMWWSGAAMQTRRQGP
jgi:hypothetical protein